MKVGIGHKMRVGALLWKTLFEMQDFTNAHKMRLLNKNKLQKHLKELGYPIKA